MSTVSFSAPRSFFTFSSSISLFFFLVLTLESSTFISLAAIPPSSSSSSSSTPGSPPPPSQKCYEYLSIYTYADPNNLEPFMISSIGDSSSSSSFPRSPVVANVDVYRDGRVRIHVTINDLSVIPLKCFNDGGLEFHVHDYWREPRSIAATDSPTTTTISSSASSSSSSHLGRLGGLSVGWAVGAQLCGAGNTGGHWDPTIACSPMTGSPYCKEKGGEVPGSSLGGLTEGVGTDSTYNCSPEIHKRNPFACEVGDFSSKVGNLQLKEIVKGDGRKTYTGDVDFVDSFLAHPCLLEGRSVVFHCSDGQRIFCGKFLTPFGS